MIFKRRQAIPVGPGMMCTIKPDVIEIAKEKPSYSRISAAYDSEQNNQQISSWRLKKSRQRKLSQHITQTNKMFLYICLVNEN